VDKPRLSVTLQRTQFVCQLSQQAGAWTAEYAGPDVGSVRVSAPTREEALRKLEGEIRYRLELCPCSGEAYRDIEVKVVAPA
jgi:hypothetical protein